MDSEKIHALLNLIKNGEYILTHHAHIRMQERSITNGDIRECARTALKVDVQDDYKFKIKGLDLTEVEMKIVCSFKSNIVIITVF